MTALNILRLGAVTPLGLSAHSTCAAYRAGIKALEDVYCPPFPVSPVVGGKVPASVRLRRTFSGWLLNLATRALAEAIDGFEGIEDTGLILNLPAKSRKHPELPDGYEGAILFKIQRRLGVHFKIAESVCAGHSGALLALLRAQELFASGAVRFCCIGGVDSLVNSYDIERLRREFRLRDEERPWGVMPSEGAGFFLTSPVNAGERPLSQVLGVGVSHEERPYSLAIREGEVSRGTRLREAFEAALKDAGVHESQVAFTITDQNGERSRSIDYVIAEMRTFRTIRLMMPHWIFCENAGDTSAAAGALMVVLATTAHQKGYAPGSLAMCAASSDMGTRVASLIQATA